MNKTQIYDMLVEVIANIANSEITKGTIKDENSIINFQCLLRVAKNYITILFDNCNKNTEHTRIILHNQINDLINVIETDPKIFLHNIQLLYNNINSLRYLFK